MIPNLISKQCIDPFIKLASTLNLIKLFIGRIKWSSWIHVVRASISPSSGLLVSWIMKSSWKNPFKRLVNSKNEALIVGITTHLSFFTLLRTIVRTITRVNSIFCLLFTIEKSGRDKNKLYVWKTGSCQKQINACKCTPPL